MKTPKAQNWRDAWASQEGSTMRTDAWTTEDDKSNILASWTEDGRVLLTVATERGVAGATLSASDIRRLETILAVGP